MYTTALPINAQDGLIMSPGFTEVVGIYSHHLKVIFLKVAHLPKDQIVLPEPVRAYQVIERFTDSFSLQMWRPSGWTCMFDALEEHKKYKKENAEK